MAQQDPFSGDRPIEQRVEPVDGGHAEAPLTGDPAHEHVEAVDEVSEAHGPVEEVPVDPWAPGYVAPAVVTEVEERPFLEEDPLAARRSRAVLAGGLASLLLASMGGLGAFLLLRDPAGAGAAQIAVGDGTTTTAVATTVPVSPPGPTYAPLPTLPIPTTVAVPPGLPTTPAPTGPRGSVPTQPNQPPAQPPQQQNPGSTTTTQSPSSGATTQVVPPAGVSVVYIESSSASVTFPFVSGGTYYSNTDSRKLNSGQVIDLAYSPGNKPVPRTSGGATLSPRIGPPMNEGGSGSGPIFLKAKQNATSLKITGTPSLIEYWDGTKKLASGTSTTFPAGTQYIAVFPQPGSSVTVSQA